MIHKTLHHPSNKHAVLFLNAVELKERADSTHETVLDIHNPYHLNFTLEMSESFKHAVILLLSVSGGKDSDAIGWSVKKMIELTGEISL